MNQPTLLVLTALIALSPFKAFAQNVQTDVDNQPVQQEHVLTEEEYLEQEENLSQEEVKFIKQLTKIKTEAEMRIKASQMANDLVNQIDVGGGSGYQYEYGY
jgi:hypothetical protein